MASMLEAKTRANKIDTLVTCGDLQFIVSLFLQDGRFKFYPDALVMTWNDFYFVFQEHQASEVYCKDEVVEIRQCRAAEIESHEHFLNLVSLRKRPIEKKK